MASAHHAHKRFSDKLAFVLNNPIRRWFYPPERLIAKFEIRPSDVVVDFGCGPGFYLTPLAKAAGRAIGIDVSTRMLERAASQAKKNKVTVEPMQSNGTDIKLPDNCVDLIFLVHVLHEVEDKPTVLGEFRRILKPDGRLAIVEKTRPDRLLPSAFSPPIVDENEVVEDVQLAGFAFRKTIPNGKDSIIMFGM